MTKSFTNLFGLEGPLDSFDTAPIPPTFVGASPALVQSTPATSPAALYLTEAGTNSPVSISDINQGQLGDCFLLSPIGDLALLKPAFITNMIHANPNNTETVTLYVASNGALPSYNTTAFKAVSVTVTNVFPTDSVDNGANQDVVNGIKEIWPQVLEKAVATLDGGYNAIANGGSPLIALEELTGHAASSLAPAATTLAQLISDSAANDLLVFDTKSIGALTNNLVNSHAYMFEGLTGTGAAATIKLGNPWGTDQPAPILLSALAKNFSEIDVGHMA
jgi:hypothetical protein